MYDRILLPTDGSAGMTRVIDHAGELAHIHDASVHALYVVDTASLTTMPMDVSLDSLHGLMQEEGENAVAEARRRMPDGVDVDRTITDGAPATQIIDCADEADCDVVVMGTHGRGGLNRLLLGSVAEHVVRRSSVPVVTVRVGEEVDPESGEESPLQQVEN
ncbi:universal stress protein [Halobacteria archaeon HArc-gm2]|nr:universal stress protein [Halobacteria archaeon HArc-gm2]